MNMTEILKKYLTILSKRAIINERCKMRIGLFDSGIGGLTVLKKLLEKYPQNDYIYYGDTLNVPYGNKSKKELLKLAQKDIAFLLTKNVDLIIIACGTVSTNCLEELRKIYQIPLISIVEPTVDYLNTTNYKNIGVIATSATIDSHIFKNNLKIPVYEIKAPELVPIIENNNHDKLGNTLETYLKKYQHQLDALVLGCTHYPIIKEEIKDILNDNTKIIDMADYIEIPNDGNGTLNIYFSKIDACIIDNTKRIITYSEKEVEKVIKVIDKVEN